MRWHKAPTTTHWGQMMVVGHVEIDRDHTLDLYCENDQIPFIMEALQEFITKEMNGTESAKPAYRQKDLQSSP